METPEEDLENKEHDKNDESQLINEKLGDLPRELRQRYLRQTKNPDERSPEIVDYGR
ncbi:MAG: hypothetical protein ABII07_05350 [Patescibacteria group bacterium]|nr:hypothetical protein [Patescibacteria group bacterium]